jgi:hypothetical protein
LPHCRNNGLPVADIAGKGEKNPRAMSIRLGFLRRRDREAVVAPANQRNETMRVMVIVKATKDSEAGLMPTAEEFRAMGNFNEELVKAGIMLDGGGGPMITWQGRF